MKNKLKKAYNIVSTGTNDAEINLYGEVVENRPKDWWTDEPVTDMYIVASELLADLDELSTKDNITVHINSVGGELFAGLSIYNRLKALPANVTTVVDGLAASAASLIFQAGDTRQVHASSTVMVHQAMTFMWGYYQSNDMEKLIKQLEACDSAVANVYAEASGKDINEMMELVNAETWMTGQEAVEYGLADEVISDDMDITMSLSHDKKHVFVNGVSLSTKGMRNIPAGIPVMPANKVPNAEVSAGNKNTQEGSNDMEVENMEDLKNAYPDLVEQVRADAFTQGEAYGAQAERERLQGIEAIEAAVADKALINEAKYGEQPMTAESLALKAMQAQAALGNNMVADMIADTNDSKVDDVIAAPVDDIKDEKAVDMSEAVSLYNKTKTGGQ